jgi:hypothetical protein
MMRHEFVPNSKPAFSAACQFCGKVKEHDVHRSWTKVPRAIELSQRYQAEHKQRWDAEDARK